MRTPHAISASLGIGLAVLAFSVATVFAQTTGATTSTPAGPDANQITNCTQGGQQPVAVGTTAATGIYVPVNDSAVMNNTSLTVKNTGILVYKECVLREIVTAQRKATTAVTVANGTNAYMTGRNGGPLFAQRLQQERVTLAADPEMLLILKDGTFDTIAAPWQNQIKQAIGQGYYAATRNPSAELACPYQGNLDAIRSGHPQGSTRDALLAIGTMPCNPILVAEESYQRALMYTSAAVEDMNTNLDWGRGNYPRLQLDADGNYAFTTETIITTPASFVGGIEEQLLTSGFRQQENADDINEMVSTLFSQVGTQVLSSNQGMSSLFQPTGGAGGTGGGSSYLSQVVAQQGGQLTQVTGNAALQVLNAALALEQAYNQAVSAIATTLTQTIGQLRGVERQCWISLVQDVCAPGTLSADGHTCTGVSGNNLTRIATSTQFSQAIIGNQIAPLASSTLTELTKSNAAITQLSGFIVALASNPSAQASILSQYNTAAGQGAFHTQANLTAAQTQRQSVISSTASLVQNVINTWAGTDSSGNSTIPWDTTISPGEGWCNYQSAATLTLWDQRWQ